MSEQCQICQNVIFCLGAPDPQRGTLSPGRVRGFCSAQRVPSFDERTFKNSKPFPRYWGSKFYLLAPITSQPMKLQRACSVTW